MSKESLQSSIQEKEAKILAKDKEAVKSEQGLVNEDQVVGAVAAMEQKLKSSPLSPKYQAEVSQKLGQATDQWKKEVDNFKARKGEKYEKLFKNLFDKILKDLQEFEKKPEVEELFKYIVPLYENQNKICAVMNLPVYSRGSKGWKELNAGLKAIGIDSDKIAGAQKILGVNADGEVGPQTIEAINGKIYGLDHQVKWSAEEMVYDPDEPEKIEAHVGWKKIDYDTLRALKDVWRKQENAQTVADLEACEIEEGEILAKAKSAKEAHIRNLKLLEGVGALEVPADFAALGEEVGLSSATAEIYYKSYLELPEDQRIPLKEMGETLWNLRQIFFAGVDETRAGVMLIEAFGKLINGQRENLVDNEALSENIFMAQNKYAELAGKLDEAQSRLGDLEQKKQGELELIVREVKENPDFLNFWTPSNDNSISKAIGRLREWDDLISKEQDKIDRIENQHGTLLLFSLINQHQLLKNKGKSTREVLVVMHETAGESVPEFLKPEIDKALADFQADPQASEVQKLIHAGKYDEALGLLGRMNKERAEIHPDIGSHDLIAVYRRDKDSAATKTLIAGLSERSGFPGSFADQKMSEGYIPVALSKIDTPILGGAVNIYMVKENPDGSLSCFSIDSHGNRMGYAYPEGAPARNAGREHLFDAKTVEESEAKDADMKGALQKILREKPSFKALGDASKEINGKFAPLQSLFYKTLEGNKPGNFVELAKGYAREVKFSASLHSLKSNLAQARADLEKLKAFGETGIRDEFEQKILQMEKQLSQVAALVDSGKIEAFCDMILSADFEEDSLGRWMIKDALPFLGAILTATAAIVLICTGVGSGVGGLMLMAGVGTLAGMAGHELTTVYSHYLGKAVYGDEFSNKTMLAKYATDEKVYNEKTGKWENIDGGDLAKVYGTQFVAGFASTFVLLGCGQFVGKFLSKFAAAHGATAGFKGLTARLLSKIPRLGKQEIDLLNEKGLGNMMNKLGREFLEETREEVIENAAEKGHPALGFLASLYHSLNGRSVSYKMGKYNVVADGVDNSGDNEVNTTWTYDASHKVEFAAMVKAEYGKSGFRVRVGEGGIVVAETAITLKDGSIAKNTMIFKPTTESMGMRQMLTEGVDSSGKGEIERLYGLERLCVNYYGYTNISPDGKITLTAYLKRNGYVILPGGSQVGFTAIKGGERVSFELQAEGDTNKDQNTDEEHEDDLIIQIPEKEMRLLKSEGGLLNVFGATSFRGKPYEKKLMLLAAEKSSNNALALFGDYADRPYALEVLNKAAKLNPDAAVAFFDRYSFHPSAESILRGALQVSPESAFKYAYIYKSMPWAEDVLRDAARAAPESALKYAGGYLGDRSLRTVIEEAEDDVPESFSQKMNNYLQFSCAEEVIRTAADAVPEKVFEFAHVYADEPFARELFMRAVELVPDKALEFEHSYADKEYAKDVTDRARMLLPEGYKVPYKPLFDTAEKVDRIKLRVDEMIKEIIENDTDVIFVLDRAARPIYWMIKEAWDVKKLGRECPIIKFLNVGNEKREVVAREYLGKYDESVPSRSGFNSDIEYKEALKGFFNGFDSAGYVENIRRDLGPLLRSGGRAMIIDDFSASGFTLDLAGKFLEHNFPELRVKTHALLSREDMDVFAGEGLMNGTHLPWNTDKSYTGMAREENVRGVTARVEINKDKRAKSLALRDEVRRIFGGGN